RDLCLAAPAPGAVQSEVTGIEVARNQPEPSGWAFGLRTCSAPVRARRSEDHDPGQDRPGSTRAGESHLRAVATRTETRRPTASRHACCDRRTCRRPGRRTAATVDDSA